MARPLRPEHLQAAFQAMAWEGWTYEAAMADDVRSRIVRLRARQIAQRETLLRRYVARPLTRQMRPHVEALMSRLQPHALADLKRAAAGDRDD